VYGIEDTPPPAEKTKEQLRQQRAVRYASEVDHLTAEHTRLKIIGSATQEELDTLKAQIDSISIEIQLAIQIPE
jgi:hypothetical protein